MLAGKPRNAGSACQKRLCKHNSAKSTKKAPVKGLFSLFRAGKGFRTLDIDLGKVALYQLSYSRELFQM